MEIRALGLFVNDMETMVKFYRDIIGLKTDWKDGDPAAEFETGECWFILYGRKDFEKMTAQQYDYPKGTNGTMVIGFNLKTYDDVDKEYERLLGLGVKSIFKPTTNPYGQLTCYVADPDGNLLEIGSYGKLEG